ncbi:DUF4393 domain-containing protein [Enterococcus casseliflavus]|uniref:DUF4393 domain-containing protein n=1 Tax=Enterococcus casseliflavus TaxID=37734 RepID=UPI0023D83939|nr:DUF4393 domain-containing protein [Enterococcus casseliflavus]WEI91437.1 DUF4393 domain-containing protein [Enterococcus casseliflavus]
MSEEKKSLINIELIPKELITNVLGPSSIALGEGLGGIVNYILLPLRKLNVVKEKEYNDFIEKINGKTDTIPVENRDVSKIGLALKLMEDTRYQLEEKEMREYCANLLAGLVDNRKNIHSTPRFSTILSNLTVTDIKLLEVIIKSPKSVAALISLAVYNKETSVGMDSLPNIVLDGNDYHFEPLSFETLNAYNLLEIHHNDELVNSPFPKIYDEFEESSDFQKIVTSQYELFKDQFDIIFETFGISMEKGFVTLSETGRTFSSFIFGMEQE